MKCVLIVSPGEKSEGASELHRMGYELELYPSTADLSPLRDAREEESASYLGRSPASAERSHVRSLRASFIRLLEDRNYAGSDLIIFGESDAVPMVASSRLETALRKEMKEHPETDIFRLFHHAVWSPQGLGNLMKSCLKISKRERRMPIPPTYGERMLSSSLFARRPRVARVLPITGCRLILPWRRQQPWRPQDPCGPPQSVLPARTD